MTLLISLDGGNRAANNHACYAASWQDGELMAVAEVTLRSAAKLGPVEVAVERPAFDGRIIRGVPPGVIIDLAWNAARVAYTFAQGLPVHEYTPTTWIGGTRKPVLHLRIWRALTPPERRAFPAETEAWIEKAAEKMARAPGSRPWEHPAFNTLDAAGVGLFHLGRIKKGGVMPIRLTPKETK